MDVMTMARSIGLVAADRREVSGTIEEAAVLDAIAELAEATPADDDLYADAAMRVQLARSAGTVHADELSILHPRRHLRLTPPVAASGPGGPAPVGTLQWRAALGAARDGPVGWNVPVTRTPAP